MFEAHGDSCIASKPWILNGNITVQTTETKNYTLSVNLSSLPDLFVPAYIKIIVNTSRYKNYFLNIFKALNNQFTWLGSPLMARLFLVWVLRTQ
jgi:hypothetical protein